MSADPQIRDPLAALVDAIASRVAADITKRVTATPSDQPVQLDGKGTERALALLELQTKLGLTVEEAAALTGIGQAELRKRCAAPETSKHHLRHVRIGRKILIPRIELERLMSEAAQ